MFTTIEQEEFYTTLYACIEDNVVVVSLMFFCNSFPDEQRFSIIADKSEVALCMFSHSRIREEFLSSNFNGNGTLVQNKVQKNIILLQLLLRIPYSLALTLACTNPILCSHILATPFSDRVLGYGEVGTSCWQILSTSET